MAVAVLGVRTLLYSVSVGTKNAAEEIKSRCANDASVSVHTLNSWGNNYIKANVLKNPRIISGKDTKWYVLNSLQPVWMKYSHRDKFESLLTGRSRIKNSEKILELIDEFKNIGFKHSHTHLRIYQSPRSENIADRKDALR